MKLLGIYLKIPSLINNKTKKTSDYKWNSSQICKMLKNEVYIGNVVGRKFRKISHKVDKVKATKKEEYIVVKNMHEPIIDNNIWNKAQEKLKKFTKVKTHKYEQPLKDFIFCAECGGKATYRIRTEQRKKR